jgi:hypothetical protein
MYDRHRGTGEPQPLDAIQQKMDIAMDAPEEQTGSISRYREGPSLLEAAVIDLSAGRVRDPDASGPRVPSCPTDTRNIEGSGWRLTSNCSCGIGSRGERWV